MYWTLDKKNIVSEYLSLIKREKSDINFSQSKAEKKLKLPVF